MSNSEQENCNRCRRRLGLKHGLTVLCLLAIANITGAHNYNSQFNFNFNLSPYPLARTLNESVQEKNVAVEKISDNKEKYCLKPECIHTASRVMNFMDESLDPCDNFYEFACGRYMSDQEISDGIYENNNFLSTQRKINQKIKNILEKVLKPTEPKYVKLMKTFYRNCMNSSEKENLILNAIVDVMGKIDRLMNKTNISNKNESWHWEKHQAQIMQETNLLITSFFELNFVFDTKNNSNNVLWIQQPLNLFKNNSDPNDNVFSDLSNQDVNFDHLLVKIQEIKKMLINISIPEEERQSNVFDRLTVKELEGNYSNILWREIFNGKLQPTTEIRDDDIVLVSDSSFFKKLNEHINNISKIEQKIYLTWTVIDEIITDDNLQKSKDKKQWEECIDLTRDSFMSALGALYVKNDVNGETINKHIDELTTNIFHQFNIIINNVDWLDQKTRDYALEKLSSLYAERQSIYQISDDKEIDDFFTNWEITAGDFYESVVNVRKFTHESKTQLYRVPVNRSSFSVQSDATEVNAFNFINMNRFGISPGIFQGIFFNESRPMYMNYGAIGTIAGHEFTHGFDSRGKHYDKNGNLNDWWEPSSQKQFDEKAKCFVSQYKNYKDKEANLNVNGIRTLAENIADNVGLKISYSAYQKWVKDHGSEPLLPGLNYTQSQLFWISFAQAFCHKGSPKHQKSIIKEDEHSPKEFRVIGSLSNRPEFAKDFQCPEGSKMNPKAKCSVW